MKRLSLVAGYAAPPEPQPRRKPAEPQLDVERPGELVQVDCLRIGRLRRTKGLVWQYTAIDVGSAYGWAELHVTPHDPVARSASHLVQRVARDLEGFGWKMEAVMTGDGGELRARAFRDTVLPTPPPGPTFDLPVASTAGASGVSPATYGSVHRIGRGHKAGSSLVHPVDLAGPHSVLPRSDGIDT